mgnify:FL=1
MMEDTMNFDGKFAVITGSSNGIGAEAAKKITSLGGRVTINYSKSKELAEEVAHECSSVGITPLLIKADVATDDGCKYLIDSAMKEFKSLNILINNAGRTKFASHSDLDALNRVDFENILGLNLISNYELVKIARPYLANNNRSSIVNISSVAGLKGLGSSIAYASSKGALNSMTLALSRSLGPDGIRVNAVCPGFVATDWWKNRLGDDKFKKTIKTYEQTNPLGEAPTAEDIVGSIIFFASDLSNHVTGQLLAVDGGLLNGMPIKLD